MHSIELSSNLEDCTGTKEKPFLFPSSSPRKTQGSFFSYDDSISLPGGNQSSYDSGLDDSCIESLHSSMRSTVSQSDVFSLMPITKPHLRPRYSYTDGPPKRRIDADASLTRCWHELNLLRDEVHLPPGENNPNAVPGGKLCFEYMNKGRYI